MENGILVFNNASEQAAQFIGALNASQECVMAAVPFLCLYFFGGVCDENMTHFLLDREECFNISTGVCRTEWEVVGKALPNCTILPGQDSVNCPTEVLLSSGKNKALVHNV